MYLDAQIRHDSPWEVPVSTAVPWTGATAGTAAPCTGRLLGVNGEPGEKRGENHGKTMGKPWENRKNRGKPWENQMKDVKMVSDLVESVKTHGNDL